MMTGRLLVLQEGMASSCDMALSERKLDKNLQRSQIRL